MDNWKQLNSLFDMAADLPEGERSIFLDAEAGVDTPLRRDLESLLREVGGGGDLVSAVVRGAREVPEPEMSEAIGPYRLIREIGSGGMGAVWLAERADGEFEQTVAIKLIKFGLANEELVRRFRHERQILSRLNHPHIARLLDGGATAGSLPYLVMEHVDGLSITEYVRVNKSELRQILKLFRTVCSAVQHAHSNLVVHRDLKPANIMVTVDGAVKLLDFGIAKLLEVDGDSDITVNHWLPFTPAYASPEQKLGQTHSTLSDIYSLGKILSQLVPHPDRDLNAIIAKATREEPRSRYSTATQLMEDVDRYLADEPVNARDGNLRYQAAKFVRRHRIVVLTAALFLIVVFGFSAWTAIQNERIKRERDRAESVASFMRSLFAAADPERNQGNRVSTRELLDLGSHRVRNSIADPITRSQIVETIGEAYFHLGMYDRAIPIFEELLKGEGVERARVGRIMGWLAEAETSRGKRSAGEAWGSRAVSEVASETSAVQAEVLLSRCSQLHGATKFAEAAKACEAAVAKANASTLSALGKAPMYTMLGTALKDSSDFKGAEAALQKAITLSAGADDQNNSAHAQAKAELASVYFRQGRMKEAELSFREAVVFKRKLYPEGHLDLARALNNHANAVGTLKNFPEAIRLFEEAHAMYRRYLGAESSELASSMSNMAVVLASTGDLSHAAVLLREVIEMQTRTIGPGKPPLLSSQIKLAAVLLEANDYKSSAALLEPTLGAYSRLQPQPKIEVAYSQTLLSLALQKQGQAGRALALASESATALTAILKDSHWMRQLNDTAKAGALLRNGRKAEAARLLAPLVENYEANHARNWRVALAYDLSREAGNRTPAYVP